MGLVYVNDETETTEEEELEMDRVDPSGLDAKFLLLRKIEKRKFIYDASDPKHSKRDLLATAWEEISTGIKINGKAVTSEWCKSEWKKLRDYHGRIVRARKGNSRKAATKAKPWIYFSTVDRILSVCKESNTTQSNLEGVDSDVDLLDPESNQTGSSSGSNEIPPSSQVTPMEWTPRAREGKHSSNKNRGSGRMSEDQPENMDQDSVNRILKVPEELRDEAYYFSMSTAAKLRRLPDAARDFAMKKISDVLYDLLIQESIFK